MNRSALIRQALQEHLKRLRDLELEERDRRGYLAQPQREDEFRLCRFAPPDQQRPVVILTRDNAIGPFGDVDHPASVI